MHNTAMKTLVAIGSLVSIGFGVWHFFVPRTWNWYAFMDPAAPELSIAVRAINIFFSLCLILFGLMNIALAFGGEKTGRFAILVVLGATVVLWATRVVLQIVSPQGSTNAALQYGMLGAFAMVLACHLVPLIEVAAAYRQSQ